MQILVTGDAARWEALQAKPSGHHTLRYEDDISRTDLSAYALVIDLSLDDTPGNATSYAQYPDTPVLGNVVKTSLQALREKYNATNIIGCNWLPGFLHMPLLEMSCTDDALWQKWEGLQTQLGWESARVADMPGLVTPRVVSMIINEAYFTAAEGTASREDIDLAMKLGTNYPYGPFEWGAQIGLAQVVGILHAVKAATGMPRYEICPLLEAEALNHKN